MNLNDYGFVKDFELNSNASEGDTLVVAIMLEKRNDGDSMEYEDYDKLISGIRLGETVHVTAGGNDYTGKVAGFVTDDTWGFQVRILIGE